LRITFSGCLFSLDTSSVPGNLSVHKRGSPGSSDIPVIVNAHIFIIPIPHPHSFTAAIPPHSHATTLINTLSAPRPFRHHEWIEQPSILCRRGPERRHAAHLSTRHPRHRSRKRDDWVRLSLLLISLMIFFYILFYSTCASSLMEHRDC